MNIWLRLLITFLLMLFISFLAGKIWWALFNHIIPSYISGVIGGLVAVPAWEALKKFKPKIEK
jgi:hypothetical protein